MTTKSDFANQRAWLLRDALEASVECCGAPDQGRNDQFWLRHFSSETITADSMSYFLHGFQLARYVKWNEPAIAEYVNGFRRREFSDIRTAVNLLATDLQAFVVSKKKGVQTSAASKILFFARPHDEVYIWDSRARDSLAFRSSQTPNTYGAYHECYAKVLNEEREKADFVEFVSNFIRCLDRVGGPMADPSTKTRSFVERRFLDKLMWMEGRWLKPPKQ